MANKVALHQFNDGEINTVRFGTSQYIGAVAQLVAHLHGMQGVRGSNPLSSTNVMSRDIVHSCPLTCTYKLKVLLDKKNNPHSLIKFDPINISILEKWNSGLTRISP